MSTDCFILDRVVARESEFKKTWLLQAMKRPEESPSGLVITNGKGRQFVQTLLPRDPQARLCDGQDLYRYGDERYSPQRDTGSAPECRIEISPSQSSRTDYCLHVLTATDATVEPIQPAVLNETDTEVRVPVGRTTISFDKGKLAGSFEIAGHRQPFADAVAIPLPYSVRE